MITRTARSRRLWFTETLVAARYVWYSRIVATVDTVCIAGPGYIVAGKSNEVKTRCAGYD